MSEILGVLFAIFVGTLVIPKFVDYQRVSNDNTRAAVTAQQQKQLNTAAATYIQQNAVAIQAAATVPSTPVVITVAMLQAPAVNLLPTSFSSTNPYGQTWQVAVLQPIAGNLQALAMSTGGSALPDTQAGKIAAIVGASGGLIPQNDSGIYPGAAANAYGSFGGWTISTANYPSVTGGHPAALLTFNNGQLVSNYLYRNAVPGQPQLNQMGTALDMNGNAINNASQVNTGILAATGNATVGGTLGVTGTATVGNLTTAGIATADMVQINHAVIEGDSCGSNGLVAKDSTGLLLSCQSGLWKKAVKAPNLYRFMFTSSTTWTVPNGVSSAFVTMAGGGGSGAGWRISNASITGYSGGYVFSQPVNLVAGETIQITIGQGGQVFQPYNTGVPAQPGPPYYIYGNPGGDDGLGGYPGGSSMLVSPSAGTLLECDGGSGAVVGGINNYSGTLVAGNMQGAQGGGITVYDSPNRVAAGPYAHTNGPGACGPNDYGIGNAGLAEFNENSSNRSGGKTPFGYGSGGDIRRGGCYVNATDVGLCTWPQSPRDGVVMIDVLY